MTACEEQQLLCHVRSGDDKAFAVLLDQCMPMIRQETARLRCHRVDEDDLAQEAALGLLSAAQSFCVNGGASFVTYARVCIRHRLINTVSRHSAVEIPHESPFMLHEETKGITQVSPDHVIVELEAEKALLHMFKSLLSGMEYRVLILHIASYSYEEIAQYLHTTSKSVDNALQRVRRKLKNAL